MGCEFSEDLTVQYLMAVDEVKLAQRDADRAFTQLQCECAAKRLDRVETHRVWLREQLADHFDRHRCCTAEIKAMLLGADSKLDVSAFAVPRPGDWRRAIDKTGRTVAA